MLRRSVLSIAALVAWSLLGAGASTAIAEDAAILIAPAELQSGGRSSFTLTTFDAQSGAPLPRPVVVHLVGAEGDPILLYAGATGDAGRVRAEFDVPPLPAGAWAVEARIGGLDEPLRAELGVSDAPAILIETDKPIYKPGQTLRGRVVLVDNALRPVAGEVELTFHDAKGNRVHRQSVTTGELGAAAWSLDLASEVNYGPWTVRAHAGDVESSIEVRVEEYTLPRFEIEVESERDWALVDEEISGSVVSRYFFGRDVAGSARVVAKRWVGQWEVWAEASGELAEGRFDFVLPAVGFLVGSPGGGSAQGEALLEVEVVDSTGHAQSMTTTRKIVEAPVVLGVGSRSDTLDPGLPAELIVTTRSPDGGTLDASVDVSIVFYDQGSTEIDRLAATVDTVAGRAAFDFQPPESTFWAQCVATTERDGRTARAELRLGVSWSTSNEFLSISREDGAGSASVGSIVRFSALSTSPGAVYWEVIAAGRGVMSGATDDGAFEFAVTPAMAPKVKVIAYRLTSTNEVLADSAAVEVTLASTISIDARFDRAEAGPAETITLSIDAGTGERTLVGLSVVDQSVLALGKSRLGWSEVFAELERRFLEPIAVGVGGGEEPGGGLVDDGLVGLPGPGLAPWAIPPSVGALDVLESARLVVAATSNVSVPRGQRAFGWDDAVDFDGGLPPEAGGGEPPAPSEAPRVRQFFPETWVWEPLLLTDDEGVATLELTTPDSITGWKLQAVGTSASGLGFGESELTVFQEFFVEPSLPSSVTRGEEVGLKVDVFNYLDEPQTVALSLAAGEWYELLGESELSVEVGPSSATSVRFPIRPVEIGEHDVELTAIGSSRSDAVRRPLRVDPEGVPRELVVNDVIAAGEERTIDLTFPEPYVLGSERAWLYLTPNPVSQTMEGVSDLLNMPYGCGEQNMIFLAPDIEILKYLRETGELRPEVRAIAEYYVNVGYQRELTFQTDDGGFAAFGGAQGSLWLTAFVLSTFSGAREVRDIDENVLARAAAMLVSRQLDDGSFQTDEFLIHREMDGGLENRYAMSAYVANALADYADGVSVDASVEQAIARAGTFLAGGRSMVASDAYSSSILAVALQKIPGLEAVAEEILDQLLALAIDEGVGIHWEPYPVETTGYAAIALLSAGRPQAAQAVDWLTTQRNSLGGYGGSTQDTVVAIRALFLAARDALRDLDLDVRVLAGDETLATVRLDASTYDLLHAVSLPLGGGDVRLTATGSGSSAYQVARRFHVPGGVLPPPRDAFISVSYRTEGVEVDETIEVVVRLRYEGAKEVTSMVLADIGVPTGFAPVRSSLDALVEAELIARAEIAGRRVILYLDELRRGETVELVFSLRALYPVRAEGPVSRVYEYYDPDVEAWHVMGPVVVTAPDTVEPTFIRGDSNLDAAVDLSDAVATLEHLFTSPATDPVTCRDAADANDDGALDITDPIRVLGFLFLGGPAPSAPFPEPGVDPTPDALDCVSGL